MTPKISLGRHPSPTFLVWLAATILIWRVTFAHDAACAGSPSRINQILTGLGIDTSIAAQVRRETDVTGSTLVQGRPGVLVVPGETPLDLTGRIIRHGAH